MAEKPKMEVEDHTKSVGAIITNLQALETVARYFLLKANGQDADFPKPGDTNTSITYLTDFRSLRGLTRLYNEKLTSSETQYNVDILEVCKIRDAFAHGRLVTMTELPATLWKFGSPVNGRVPIEFCEVLTLEYMTATWKMIDGERGKVVACFKARRYQGLR